MAKGGQVEDGKTAMTKTDACLGVLVDTSIIWPPVGNRFTNG
jgi:hypothetical protein